LRSLTTLFDHRPENQPVALQLLVMGPDLFFAHPLPRGRTLTIGRADNVDVQLTDPMASRVHARIHVGPTGTLEVEDVGSINKTKVRDTTLAAGERVGLLPGEAITIGSTILMAQEAPAVARPRRVWPHTYFEARLEEECLRSTETRASFVMVRLGVGAGGATATERDRTQAGAVAETIGPALRASDMLALYAPCELEILLPNTTFELATAIVQDLVGRLRTAGLAGKTGIAAFGRDGQTAEAIAARASERLRGIESPAPAPDKVVVEDARMRRVYQLARSAAAGVINVLILGETGVGKDVMAEAIHRMSPRAKGPFLSINCTNFSETLLESELFGHEKGAFTGATAAKPGLLETAQGGTVFLDEIGDMPMGLQAKILRVIETRQLSRVGSVKSHAIDVRFVAATNKHLEAEIGAGRFRRDLFYRLNGMSLQLPPLRERRAEILPLARMFLAQLAEPCGLPAAPPLSPEAERVLESYPWPGNVREVRNMMERALLLCEGGPILPEHLPLENMAASAISFLPADPGRATAAPAPAVAIPVTGDADPDAEEKERFQRVLAECGGNQSRAAKQLGIARSTLIARLEAWNVPRPRK
jgi:DNA-binding NtrC family response regulator